MDADNPVSAKKIKFYWVRIVFGFSVDHHIMCVTEVRLERAHVIIGTILQSISISLMCFYMTVHGD